MLGNGRCECFCFDGVTRLGHIRGKMRKKVWITAGDIILVAKRDFQDEKVDIVHKYTADEARNLKQYGELPENARINETAVDMAMGDDNDDDDLGIRCVIFLFCFPPALLHDVQLLSVVPNLFVVFRLVDCWLLRWFFSTQQLSAQSVLISALSAHLIIYLFIIFPSFLLHSFPFLLPTSCVSLTSYSFE